MRISPLKRSFDIAAAATGLILTAPFILATAATMAIANKSNPLLVQKRVGYQGKAFSIYKIKTMKDIFNQYGEPLPEELRTTSVGKFIRKTRLDELLQLVNVLKGDMSLIGPRPLLPRNDIAHDPRRQVVLPGLTGLAQIKGMTRMLRSHSLKYDLFYIKQQQNRSLLKNFLYDLGIMAETIPSLIRHRKDPFFKRPGSK